MCCWLLLDACYSLYGSVLCVAWGLVVCCLLGVACCLFVVRRLWVVCCLLMVVCCSVFVMVVCCSLFDARCFDVWCLVYVSVFKKCCCVWACYLLVVC